MIVRALRVVLAVAVTAVLAGPALAGKVPTTRFDGVRYHGTRPDITVPYTTNGNSAFGVANGVAPRIYSAPQVDDKVNPGARPSFNLPYYGAKVGYSGSSNGLVEKPALLPSSPRR
jgi:hypothetical protein